MLQLDDRVGSIELLRKFQDYGVTPQVARLAAGDMAWTGNGPHGEVMVCVERKRITDLIQSMQERRLSGHQLPEMAKLYDYAYLLVEGVWREGPGGQLQLPGWRKGTSGGAAWHDSGMHWRAVESYIHTLEMRAGMVYRHTYDERDTVAQVVSLYRWWTEKDWDQHKAHDQVYAPATPKPDGRKLRFIPRRVSMVEKMAMQLPGLDGKARGVAEKFKTVREMVLAGEERWMLVKGIGRKMAKRIVQELTS